MVAKRPPTSDEMRGMIDDLSAMVDPLRRWFSDTSR